MASNQANISLLWFGAVLSGAFVLGARRERCDSKPEIGLKTLERTLIRAFFVKQYANWPNKRHSFYSPHRSIWTGFIYKLIEPEIGMNGQKSAYPMCEAVWMRNVHSDWLSGLCCAGLIAVGRSLAVHCCISMQLASGQLQFAVFAWCTE